MEILLTFLLGACVGVIGCAWRIRRQHGGTLQALSFILRGGGPGEEG